MKLESRIKIAHDRCVPPEETIQRLEGMLRPRYDLWFHEESVFEYFHWSAMFIEGMEFRSMGKGITPEFSKAGALAEGAEWLAARATGDLPGYVGAREHEVPNALGVEELIGHIATATPPVLDRIRNLDDAFHWVDAFSLLQDKTVKVPLEYIRLISGPNGKATGNHLEEAILHAANEIFERRAHITVLRERLVTPTIDPESISHPVIQHQMAFLKERGIRFVLKDLSFGGVLPCIGAYFWDTTIPDDFQFHHFFKVGSAFDREEALIRVFTEFTQGRRQGEFLDPDAPDYLEKLAKLLDHDFRRLPTLPADCDNFLSAFMFGMVPYRDTSFFQEGELVPFNPGVRYSDCMEDIQHACAICEAIGKDFLVVDLTDPEFGFPAAQVIVPGYSDVLPYHPPASDALFRRWSRSEVLASFPPSPPLPTGRI